MPVLDLKVSTSQVMTGSPNAPQPDIDMKNSNGMLEKSNDQDPEDLLV